MKGLLLPRPSVGAFNLTLKYNKLNIVQYRTFRCLNNILFVIHVLNLIISAMSLISLSFL